MSKAQRAPEQIRRDVWEERLVRLIERLYDVDKPPVDTWLVEDVLTEKRYVTPVDNLSTKTFVEMEVLAFVTASGTCSCCKRSGGRVFALAKTRHDLCGSCYRRSCDTRGLSCCPRKIT